jgi:hypothetical protein
MTDQEREAQIRLRAQHPNPFAMAGQKVLADDVAALLRLLDEERAKTAKTYCEVRDSLREQGYCMACEVYHRVGECQAVAKAERRGREAMRELAAKEAHKYLNRRDTPLRADVLNDAARIEAAIHALPLDPPQKKTVNSIERERTNR